MPWTLQLGATTQSLAAWGMSNVVLTLRSMQPSTLTWTRAEAFDSTADFTKGDAVTMRDPSNVVRFKGTIRGLPSDQNGGEEARFFVAEDVFGDMARRSMLQTWDGLVLDTSAPSGASPALVLFHDGAEVRNVGAQILTILEAAQASGIAFDYATLPSITASPKATDIDAVTFLEALTATAKFCPDIASRVDYTTTPPTIEFVRPGFAVERDLAVIEAADKFTIEPLYDAQVSGVYLAYDKPHTNLLGTTVNKVYVDRYPLDTEPDGENVMVGHAQLRGSRVGLVSAPAPLTQSQYIETADIDPESFAFWEQFWPQLADRTSGTLDNGTTSDGSMKRIVAGAQPSWTGSAAEIIVTADFAGGVDGVEIIEKLVARVNASTLATGTYTRSGTTGGATGSGSDLGAEVPTGLAQTLYEALSPLQWRGSHTAMAAELTAWDIMPGDCVNFTGTANAALESSRAQVQGVVYDIDNATRTLEFGPPRHLSFADLIDLQRAFRDLFKQPSRAAEISGESGTAEHTVEGSGMGPGGALVTTPRAQADHPFKVRRIGSTSNYRVTAGQIDGQTIEATTVSATVGQAIVIGGFKFDLLVDNSEFVYGSLIAEDSDPSVAAMTLGADVDTLEDGTEGRCIIASIMSGGVVGQIATKNITTTREDDGTGISGTGARARITYDKG